MNKFAKLYEYEDIGQVLVMLDTNDDGDPSLNVYFNPEDMGVCCLAASFEDSEKGWEAAEHRFETYTSDMAHEIAKNALPKEFAEALR